MSATRFASFRPLRHRNFALVWFGGMVSNIGSWMQTVAVGVLVTQLTHQAHWTGLVAAAAFLPMGLLTPIGGAMADRVDRRMLLLLTTVGETAFATVLAVLAAIHHDSPVAVTLTVLAGGVMTALGFPSYQALVPALVPREDLLGAIALGSAQWNFGRVVGPALAGLVLVLGSYTLAFALNAISFFAVIIALLLVRVPPLEVAAEEGRMWSRIASGARAAWADPGCRTAIALIGVTALLVSPFIGLIPAVALKLLHEGEGATATLVTAQGLGAVGGALLITPLAARYGRRRLLVASLVVMPFLVLLYAVSPTLPTAAVSLFLVGAGYIGVLSGLSTAVQLRVSDAYRGRVMSLFMVALGTVYPLGLVIQGTLGDHVSLRVVTAGTAALFLAVVAGVAGLRPEVLRTLDEPASAPGDVIAPPAVAPAT